LIVVLFEPAAVKCINQRYSVAVSAIVRAFGS